MLKEALLIACKDGVVELTAEVESDTEIDPSGFIEEVRERILEHQYQLMTDGSLLNPDDLEAATCILARDPLPDSVTDGLISLGFVPVEGGAGGGAQESSLFSRFSRGRRRTRLDKWMLKYTRSWETSSRLADLERSLVEDVPDGELPDIIDAACDALSRAARTYLRLLVAPDLEGVERIEGAILKERTDTRGRLILHPSFVRSLAALTAGALFRMAPESSWTEDPDSPLIVQSHRGIGVETDPELRVVNFVRDGRRALLSGYCRAVVDQSLTGAARP